MPAPLQTLDLADGRTLAFTEWGDPDGRPVLSCHGTPGCRLNRHPNQELVRSTGARVITFDRPGYGQSSRNRGRRVVDVVADVTQLVDHLGLDEFAVVGGSGGGPHALAIAAHLPERVSRVACIVGVAPYDVLGEEWFTGMDPMNVKEFGWALEGEERLHEELAREDAEMRVRVASDPSTVLGEFDLPEADRKVLARSDVAAVIRDTTEEQSANGVWGWVDDDLAFTRTWGFDPATVRVPTAVWWGEADVLVPPQHGEWIAATVPGAQTRVRRDGGHQPDPDKDVVVLNGWLLDGRPWD
ncbi:MAG TPA: alpha/beta fold hydrolase [Mycobacteriales bacterium]|nr:alpha/beta fold hydrolase [Mycobacteriales bacterium]